VFHQAVQEFLEIPPESIGRVAIVMEVNLDLAESLPSELDQLFNVFASILLRGKEKRMPRCISVGIDATCAQPRILLSPPGHTPAFRFQVCSIPARLKVVRKTEHHVDAAREPTVPPSDRMTQVAPPPDVDIAVSQAEEDRNAIPYRRDAHYRQYAR
jgi:hypothetical protein